MLSWKTYWLSRRKIPPVTPRYTKPARTWCSECAITSYSKHPGSSGSGVRSRTTGYVNAQGESRSRYDARDKGYDPDYYLSDDLYGYAYKGGYESGSGYRKSNPLQDYLLYDRLGYDTQYKQAGDQLSVSDILSIDDEDTDDLIESGDIEYENEEIEYANKYNERNDVGYSNIYTEGIDIEYPSKYNERSVDYRKPEPRLSKEKSLKSQSESYLLDINDNWYPDPNNSEKEPDSKYSERSTRYLERVPVRKYSDRDLDRIHSESNTRLGTSKSYREGVSRLEDLYTMEFAQFRDTGELSDITLVVNGKEFKLHKFPLFIKSDYFRVLARGNENKSINIDDFPGGPDIFEIVANYCYNMKVDINKENVCELRCAAEFLQMNSRGNLSDSADRQLIDMLSTAKLSRDLSCMINLVLRCCDLGAIAEQAKVVEKCIQAIVDCLLLSAKFTRKSASAFRSRAFLTDDEAYQQLCAFPLNWYVDLYKAARDKNVRPQILANLIKTYISGAIAAVKGQGVTSEADDNVPTENVNKNQEVESPGINDGEDDGESKPEAEQDGNMNPEPQKQEGSPVDKSESNENEEQPKEPVDIDLKDVLDSLILEINDSAHFEDYIPCTWALDIFNLAEEYQCDCRDYLRKLIAKILPRFQADELTAMSPTLLAEIVKSSCDDSNPVQTDMVCSVVDGYLQEKAAKGDLDVDTFNSMVEAIPGDYRMSHDTLFTVLESLLKSESESQEKVKLTEEQKNSMLETIDFRRLSETKLQQAYESDLVPQAYITKASLALCTRLRTELDAAKAVIRSQDEELQKYGHGSNRSWLTPKGNNTDHIDQKAIYIPSYTPSRMASSITRDVEVQMALDSFDRTLDLDYHPQSSYTSYYPAGNFSEFDNPRYRSAYPRYSTKRY